MATVNQKLALNAKVHKALHKNIYLLSLFYPMSKDLQQHYKEGMLEKPNSAAFHHLSYYFMTIIDPKIGSSTSWAMFEIKIEAKYRSEFLKFVNELSKEHDGHLSHIMASWLVNAGGLKVTKLMFELSQIALKVHLLRRRVKNVLNIKNYNVEEFANRIAENQESALNKISWWRMHTINMSKIAEIYFKHIPIIEKEKAKHQELLKEIVSNVAKSNVDISKELSDIFTCSDFLKYWGKNIDRKTCVLKDVWREHCSVLLNKSKRCKQRSEQVIKMHLNKSSKDYTLEYDPNTDHINIPSFYDNILTASQSATLGNIVKDGVLNLPNLLKSYGVIISYCFNNYLTNDDGSTEHFDCLFMEKKNVMVLVKDKSKDLVTELFKFYCELEDGLEPDTSFCASKNASGMLDILNIPTITMPEAPNVNCLDYWQKTLDKFKFMEFKHPFKSEKSYCVFDAQSSLGRISSSNRSIIKKGFFSSSKEPQMKRKIEAIPEYLKNIEELERNMFKIADVGNKTVAAQNMTTMGRLERRQSIFSQNHMKYLLTSIKKKSSVPDMINNQDDEKLSRKNWNNLFNESVDEMSALQKTQSSPNLAMNDNIKESRSRLRAERTTSERISGVKEINYSSFLSDLGSMPNLSAPDKENLPQNNQIIVTETILMENRMEIINISDDTTPKNILKSPTRRKSLDSLVNTYKKFKESRGLGSVKSDQKVENTSKSSADSFLEKLDLGDSKSANGRVIERGPEVSRLSTVPDLLSPSIVLKSSNTNPDSF